jgi:hypothetical protein
MRVCSDTCQPHRSAPSGTGILCRMGRWGTSASAFWGAVRTETVLCMLWAVDVSDRILSCIPAWPSPTSVSPNLTQLDQGLDLPRHSCPFVFLELPGIRVVFKSEQANPDGLSPHLPPSAQCTLKLPPMVVAAFLQMRKVGLSRDEVWPVLCSLCHCWGSPGYLGSFPPSTLVHLFLSEG